jgi:hypothetical protein
MSKSGIKSGVMRVKGWRFNERKGMHNITKRESAFGDNKGITSRYDRKEK